MDRRAFTEIGVALLVILICFVLMVQAHSLPPGSFEPLGSGPVPMFTAAIIILCCVIVIGRALASIMRGAKPGQGVDEEAPSERRLGGVLMLGGSIVYVGLLELQVASFGLITFAFLALLIWAMESFRLRKAPWVVVVAAVFAFGAEYVFTNIFVVDLPT